MFETEWQTRINNIWFAVVNDQPIGLIGLLHGSGPGTYCGELISLWVKPEYRGQGIGKRLIEHLQQYASDQRLRKLYLQVTSTQKAAINLYRTRGFTHIGTFKDHAFYEGHFFDKWVMEWLI